MKGETPANRLKGIYIGISIHSPMKGETAPNDTVYRETAGEYRGILNLFISISILF